MRQPWIAPPLMVLLALLTVLLGFAVWLAANPADGRWNLVAVLGLAVVGFLAWLRAIHHATSPSNHPPRSPESPPLSLADSEPETVESQRPEKHIVPFPGRRHPG